MQRLGSFKERLGNWPTSGSDDSAFWKEEPMHATIREYENISNPAETARQVSHTFLPLVSKLPGFVGYYFVDTGGRRMASITVFEDRAAAEASNDQAAEWVKAHPDLIPAPAKVSGGEVLSAQS
jgi:hypothetical protein